MAADVNFALKKPKIISFIIKRNNKITNDPRGITLHYIFILREKFSLILFRKGKNIKHLTCDVFFLFHYNESKKKKNKIM